MVSDRIEEIIEVFCKGNKSQFAKMIGVAPSVIGNITGERRGNPSFEVTQKILNAFVSISPDWFISGTGAMLREKRCADSNITLDDSSLFRMYKDMELKADRLLEENGGLKKEIEQLKGELKKRSRDVDVPLSMVAESQVGYNKDL